LVLHGIVEVERGPVAVEILGAELAGRADAPLGDLAAQLQAVGYPVGTAKADPVVLLPVTAGLNRLLAEKVAVPPGPGIVRHLSHHVGTVTSFLGQGDRR